MLLSVVREIKVSSDWFGCVFVVFLYVTKVKEDDQVTDSENTFDNVSFLTYLHRRTGGRGRGGLQPPQF